MELALALCPGKAAWSPAPTHLPGLRLRLGEGEAASLGYLVVQNTTYSQYCALTLEGGLVSERYNSVHAQHVFLVTRVGLYL